MKTLNHKLLLVLIMAWPLAGVRAGTYTCDFTQGLDSNRWSMGTLYPYDCYSNTIDARGITFQRVADPPPEISPRASFGSYLSMPASKITTNGGKIIGDFTMTYTYANLNHFTAQGSWEFWAVNLVKARMGWGMGLDEQHLALGRTVGSVEGWSGWIYQDQFRGCAADSVYYPAHLTNAASFGDSATLKVVRVNGAQSYYVNDLLFATDGMDYNGGFYTTNDMSDFTLVFEQQASAEHVGITFQSFSISGPSIADAAWPPRPAVTPVSFADANLEAAIREALPKPTGPITSEDMLGLTSFSANSRGITNLAGLETAVNLTNLTLNGNPISDLAPLAALIHLLNLSLGSCYTITNVTPLAGLVHLHQLDLCYNEIRDASSLAALTNLTLLWLHCNGDLASLDWLPALINLREFKGSSLEGNDCAPVAGLTNLTTLLFGTAGGLTNLSGLTNLVHLEWLVIGGNKIQDITALAGLTNLTYLDVRYNALTHLEALVGLANLNSLYLSGNPLADFTPVAGLTRLGTLYVSENELTNLDLLRDLDQLTLLDLSSNPLTDLSPLAHLTNLVYLMLNDCSLADVSVVGQMPALCWLELNHNRLRDLTALAGLRWHYYSGLLVADNELTNITTLLSVPPMDYLDLQRNALDLSSNSPTMAVIETLQSEGAVVVYQAEPQRPVFITSGPNKLSVASDGVLSLSFGTQAGVTYVVEYTESLAPPSWNFLKSIAGNGSVVVLSDSTKPGGSRFYRVRVP